jgi:hypothetical protein
MVQENTAMEYGRYISSKMHSRIVNDAVLGNLPGQGSRELLVPPKGWLADVGEEEYPTTP